MKKLFASLLLLAALILSGCTYQTTPPDENEPQATAEQEQSQTAELIIYLPGATEPQTYNLEIEETTTAMDLLEQSKLNLEYTEYSFGNLITAIAGYENGESSWSFFVNQEPAKQAADNTAIENGDTVSWRYLTEDKFNELFESNEDTE